MRVHVVIREVAREDGSVSWIPKLAFRSEGKARKHAARERRSEGRGFKSAARALNVRLRYLVRLLEVK